MRTAAPFQAIAITILAALACATPAHAQFMGACCLPDNTCMNLVNFDCFNQNGTFYFGQDCSEVDCINGPAGACCIFDLVTGYTCQEGIFQTDCDTLGGTFFSGQTCAQIPCANTGACCLPDGTCQDNVLFSDCTGEFIPNGSCLDEPCFVPISGACCLPDNTCMNLVDFDCFNQGGTFYFGQECVDVDCVNGPTGACCIFDFTAGYTCQEGVFRADCDTLGGTFFAGQTCAQIPCSNVGACCLADGTCQDNVLFSDCIGEFIPNGSCSNDPCFVPVEGACCFDDGSCIDNYPEDFCFFDGGRFSPNGLCADPDACNFPIFGACCIGDSCIEESTPDDCASRGGTFFEGAICFNLPCAPIPEPGACCLPGGSCALLLEINCIEDENGVFQGEGTTCDGVLCSVPACPCELDGDPAQLDVFDLLAYLDLWFANDPAADLDEVGGVDVFDLLLYLDCWFTGCQ